MIEKPKPSELLPVGISQSYASLILSGHRTPSVATAIAIFRETGWKHDRIGDLSKEQIDVLEMAHKPVKTGAA